MAPAAGRWSVYILHCGPRGFLYVGRTTDLHRRFAQHRAGTGARYTRAFRPTAIVWSESGHDAHTSARREAQLKRLTRRQKLALVRAVHDHRGSCVRHAAVARTARGPS